MRSRKQVLARVAARVGLVAALERVRTPPGLLVLNYHRIGEAEDSLFDRDLFSVTPSEFDRQLEWLSRRFHVSSSEEVRDCLVARRPIQRPMVLITFDDGYVDNYRQAYPLLRARGLQGTFFLVSSYVGSPDPPWWDKVAYWIRHTAKEHISIGGPRPLEIPVPTGDRSNATRMVLDAFKSSATTDPDEFLRALEQACEVALPAGKEARIFADWAEVREMLGGGMNIGSHTHGHRLLKSLSLDEQRIELEKSKALLESGVGAAISWLAYPVGRRDAFDERSRRLALECGYELAFSDYGGLNRPGQDPYDVLRNPVEAEHDFDRFRWRTMVAFHTGYTAL